MIETIRSAGIRMRVLAPAAVGAWLLTLLVALGGAIAIAAARDSSAIGELAVIYVPVMSVPLAFGVAVILLPLVSLARSVAGPGRPWLLGGIGIAVAPVQVFALLISGRVLFQGSPHMGATFAADLAAIARHPADTVVLLAAFAVGGLVLGMKAARDRETNSAGMPAITQMEPTR